MKITREEVVHVAKLAHLELGEDEVQRFSEQIGTILDYFETLNQVNTDGIKPTFNAIHLTNAFREDEEKASLDNKDVLFNAPEKEDGFFLVPRIIG
ncbi:MAG: Asp-tRNA(Asn)/Glu-tRNA(Gln) amidotransferase subunit GatC [Desulfobacteraceae bacterium]|nr:Asp-tRNA(Asn)/Glu-tRNA(Gln) amidotransferase subunit GatC [Desulfobacteraceae bacterium]MBU4000712.1 Asp-tRNA(Asn)/Glu-tRNA(Gln) amidotransferase subunit GatC [Pseudomonadota bacterium]MBU4053123.1 Asp-tRNA(Asn)/Glu-tRNA(Gln) amidotransferase subunit GatC [Pseudomonadota bacterium]